jgi:glyoxylase-like metal-dependent hydrolase (beta-lactamase superfamily II)
MASTNQGVMELVPGVSVIRGAAVNGVSVERGEKRLVVYGDPRPEAPPAAMVLLTHYRRDANWAASPLIAGGARVVLPLPEARSMQSSPEVWRDFYATLRHHDYDSQVTRFPREGWKKARPVLDGDHVQWEGLTFDTMITPGYTRGAVTYLLETGGKRIAFPGDLIYGDGQLFDIYSLQDSIPELRVRGYHGYASRAAELVSSLRALIEWKPDVMVPVRGPVITDPAGAMEKLISRVQSLFENYLYTDAYRWYFGDDNWRARAARVLGDREVRWMQPGEITSPDPLPWMPMFGNSRLLVSATGGGMLIDCGMRQVPEQVRKWISEGLIRKLEGIYVTHYHDDHTDYVQQTAEEHGCPVYACTGIREILEEPDRFRMPCLTHNPIRKLVLMEDGKAMQWHEFKLTAWNFPGQTLYHGVLLAEKRGGEKVLFVGDSFTPTGMDDYCLLNRNFVHPERGLSQCLRMIEKLPRDAHLTNQHVKPLFRYTTQQLSEMRRSLARRREILRALVPWEDPDFGVDEHWARLDPYAAEARAGETVTLTLKVLNHASKQQELRARLNLPEGYAPVEAGAMKVAAGATGVLKFPVRIPEKASGVQVITADVAFAGQDVREWCEALVRVQGSARV